MKENRADLIAECRALIERKLNWGDSDYWSDSDFQTLSRLIHERTKVQLSITTLKRIWGKVSYSASPATSTLDALAGFLGYDSWRSFVANASPAKPKKRKFRWPLLIGSGCIVILFATVIMVRPSFLFRTAPQLSEISSALSSDDFSLSANVISQGIPTSVVFTYDARNSPTDSVFIQQHWDPNRRALVPKNGHTHTSIYYEPGFFNAKLVIGDQVIKEYPLLIPTEGWLATLNDFQSAPIHLEDGDFMEEGIIDVHPDIIEKYGLNPLSDVAEVKLFNVGQFPPIPANDFVFTAQVKSNSLSGRDPCRHIWIRLVNERMPIIFPLSINGCVSNLMVSNIDSVYSGKDHDLSGFGASVSDWVNVKCVSTKNHIRYYVDNRLAFEAPLLAEDKHIMGMIVGFSGGGALRNVRIKNGEKTIFEAFIN
ncbi:hypothetical protein [Parapedobacter indicus]|uniref:Uncharacterized protein n=1 Tax=Parapedobacter indicus TaxID=1477437 RepID=A0A1I3GMY1_9SPHI|nr:hypothetical protein [Parapedobacter indicus]PPL02714.1 hypothetical protein CLV26_10340 [Parapedobacter indicus]SFI24759.1 hypothetical protein SAMN05444682_10339 [Parapedobacter indicus]